MGMNNHIIDYYQYLIDMLPWYGLSNKDKANFWTWRDKRRDLTLEQFDFCFRN